jgi:hypothetical protein
LLAQFLACAETIVRGAEVIPVLWLSDDFEMVDVILLATLRASEEKSCLKIRRNAHLRED